MSINICPSRVQYFDYASVDFLIDKNGEPVFMEVNDNTLAPYYISQKSWIAQGFLENNSGLINPNREHQTALVACFTKHLAQLPTKPEAKSIAIICKRRDQPAAINREIQYLLELFRQQGYGAEMYTPDECEVRQGYLYIKEDGSRPDLIFRRNFSFPPVGIKQPVINDLRVRKVAENKYGIHKLVAHLINTGEVECRQPKSCLVKDRNSLILALARLCDQGGECIAKPNSSYGGDGFYLFGGDESGQQNQERVKIETIVQRLEAGEEYLVQERIKTSLFRSGNNGQYCFDIRLMTYGGHFAGIEGRRSNHPFNKRAMSEKSLVTNIKRGGIDLIVLRSLDDQYLYKTKCLGSLDRVKQVNFELDTNCLVLGPALFSKVKQASESIVKAIDKVILAGEECI